MLYSELVILPPDVVEDMLRREARYIEAAKLKAADVSDSVAEDDLGDEEGNDAVVEV